MTSFSLWFIQRDALKTHAEEKKDVLARFSLSQHSKVHPAHAMCYSAQSATAEDPQGLATEERAGSFVAISVLVMHVNSASRSVFYASIARTMHLMAVRYALRETSGEIVALRT